MTKIYFPNAWGHNNVLDMFIHQTPHNSGIWNTIQAVKDKNESDYVIVQDESNEEVNMDKVIFLGREPEHIQWVNPKWKSSHKFFHHNIGNSWLPQTWWVGIEYNILENMNIPTKNKNLSIIDSGKSLSKTHSLRVNVIKEIINKYPNDVDVWGKISSGRVGITPYKGPLPHRKKEEGLLNYRYNLCIENGVTDYYFSEKICDPLLCYTMPIYYGCKNIDKFFPKGSYINIDINKSGVIDEIIEISKSNLFEENIESIKEARELILKKYNLWNTIEMAINNEKIM